MALFPFGRKAKKSQEIVITPTFIPIEWMDAYLSDGLNANQKKFLELYLSVPELQAIINYKARIFAGMFVTAEDAKGNSKDVPQLGTFARPNPIQNFKEMAMQYYVLRAIFGNSFMHPVFGQDKKQIRALWNLPPMNAEVVPTDSIRNGNTIPFNMTEIEELIKQYKFWYKGQTITYEPNEIIHYNDNQVQFDENKILLGDSKIRPLTQACENIKNAYEARGILIYNSALGIMSNETTDGQGTVEMDPTEKAQLQKDFKEQYGLAKHKWQILMTNASLKWQSMAVNVGELKLFEEVTDDFKTIANAYSFPPEVLQSGGTYENKEKALIQLYQEAIIPEADEWLQGISNWMEVDFHFKSDFSHIAVLQMDKERASKSVNWAATGLAKAVESGLIEQAEASEEFKKYLS